MVDSTNYPSPLRFVGERLRDKKSKSKRKTHRDIKRRRDCRDDKDTRTSTLEERLRTKTHDRVLEDIYVYACVVCVSVHVKIVNSKLPCLELLFREKNGHGNVNRYFTLKRTSANLVPFGHEVEKSKEIDSLGNEDRISKEVRSESIVWIQVSRPYIFSTRTSTQ